MKCLCMECKTARLERPHDLTGLYRPKFKGNHASILCPSLDRTATQIREAIRDMQANETRLSV